MKFIRWNIYKRRSEKCIKQLRKNNDKWNKMWIICIYKHQSPDDVSVFSTGWKMAFKAQCRYIWNTKQVSGFNLYLDFTYL